MPGSFIALGEKVRYCVQMIGLADWVASLAPDDEAKRLVGGLALIYVDAFTKLAPRLKNLVRARRVAVDSRGARRSAAPLEDGLRRVVKDYEAVYAAARDGEVAHVAANDPVAAILSWNSIHETSVGYFHLECATLYAGMHALEPSLPVPANAPDLGHPRLAARLTHVAGIQTARPSLGFDHRAWTRRNTVVIAHGGHAVPVSVRFFQY
jgi:hypothetical protein